MVVIKINKKEQAQELAKQISETVVALVKLKRKIKKQINGMFNAIAAHFDSETFVCKILYNDKVHALQIELREPKDQQSWYVVTIETELDGKSTICFRKNLIIKYLDTIEPYDADELIEYKGFIKKFLKKRIFPTHAYLDRKSI